jgi:general secretion pathway protein A
MYEAFYGLSSKPFQLNPDPNFYFASKQHRRAKAYLEYGVSRNEGFIVITGEIGAGKTMVLRSLIEGLNGSNVITGHLVTTQLGAEDTLRMVGAAFGFRVKDVPKSELLITLEAFLISQTSKGKRCLLVVDEAQNLTPRAVEELRMLSNFQFGNQALLQSFLVGQPEFREILQRPEMEQFRQRVAATCHIGPLDADETKGYIEHRLKCAGSTGKPSFEAAVSWMSSTRPAAAFRGASTRCATACCWPASWPGARTSRWPMSTKSCKSFSRKTKCLRASAGTARAPRRSAACRAGWRARCWTST